MGFKIKEFVTDGQTGAASAALWVADKLNLPVSGIMSKRYARLDAAGPKTCARFGLQLIDCELSEKNAANAKMATAAIVFLNSKILVSYDALNFLEHFGLQLPSEMPASKQLSTTGKNDRPILVLWDVDEAPMERVSVVADWLQQSTVDLKVAICGCVLSEMPTIEQNATDILVSAMKLVDIKK